MKHSWKTRVTALMFSAAAIGAGALSVSCGVYGPPNVPSIDIPADSDGELSGSAEIPTLYGPPGISETDAEIDLDAMTDADFRNITDEQLISLSRQSHDGTLTLPAYLTVLRDADPALLTVAKYSASTDSEAKEIASDMISDVVAQNYTGDDAAGRWRVFGTDDSSRADVLIWDPSFFDMETQTLNAKVTKENMLLLAALREYPTDQRISVFVKEKGSRIVCTEYDLDYRYGGYGRSDTAALYGYTYFADRKTGRLTGYDSDQYDFFKEVEIPDSYHPYPDR